MFTKKEKESDRQIRVIVNDQKETKRIIKGGTGKFKFEIIISDKHPPHLKLEGKKPFNHQQWQNILFSRGTVNSQTKNFKLDVMELYLVLDNLVKLLPEIPDK